MMADKRAFKTLAASMERRANELLDYVKLPEATDRGVKGKKDKLSKDIDALDEIVGRCVDASDGASEEVLKKQQDVITKVEKALEGAEDFLALEDYKRDIATKELEVACVCQSVGSRMEQFKARVAKLSLNDESKIVMSTELDELAVMIKDGLEKNKSLMLNDVANREKYQTNQTKLDGFSGEIVDSRLLLIKKSESESDGANLSSTDIKKNDREDISVAVTSRNFVPQETTLSVPPSTVIVSQTQTNAGLLTGPVLGISQGGQSLPRMQTGFVTMSTPNVPMPASTIYQGINAPMPGNTFGYSNGSNMMGSPAQNMTTAGYYSHPGQHFISSGYGTSIDRGIVSPPYVTSGYNSQFLGQPVSKVQIQKIKPPIFDCDVSKYPAWKKR